MARFQVQVDVEAPVERTWAVITDWPRHAGWVPLTRVRVLTPSPRGIGARFVARTGVGPLGFDDLMQVVEWRDPDGDGPGRCTVVKLGRLVRGLAWFEVTGAGPGRSSVVWYESIELGPVLLTRPFAPVVARFGVLAFTRALQAMAREAAGQGRDLKGARGG